MGLIDFDYLFADLLTVTPYTPSPEPVKYDKKDGHWYSHDGVDVKETQQRKGQKIFSLYGMRVIYACNKTL